MNPRCIRLYFVMFLCALFGGQSGLTLAAPVIYIENFDGDLPGAGFPLPILPFDIGVNIVSGRFGIINEVDSDFDSFAFTVPSGTKLVAGQVQLFDLDLVGGDVDSSFWLLRTGSANSNGGTPTEALDPFSPGVDTMTSVPLGPNVYNVTHVSFNWSEPPPALSDYVFTFEIVPEPATVGLWMIGCVLLQCYRRRL